MVATSTECVVQTVVFNNHASTMLSFARDYLQTWKLFIRVVLSKNILTNLRLNHGCLWAKYSPLSNCRNVTLIYFRKICTPLRSYWIVLRQLDFRIFWKKFQIFFWKSPQRIHFEWYFVKLVARQQILKTLFCLLIWKYKRFVSCYAYCIALRQLILAIFVKRYAYSIVTAIRYRVTQK